MRKLLTLAAAVAILALGGINSAKAQDAGTAVTFGGMGLGPQIILTSTALAMSYGVYCMVRDLAEGGNPCGGRDNAVWASTQGGQPIIARVPATDLAIRQYVDGSYNARLGL